MVTKNNQIRPIALLLVKNAQDELLVFQATDAQKQQVFYRFLGGGIEFGETSDQALRREIQEEISAEIEQLQLVTVLENIFSYDGLDMHELVFVYQAEFQDQNLYAQTEFAVRDSKPGRKATWVDRTTLRQAHFYPDGIKDYI